MKLNKLYEADLFDGSSYDIPDSVRNLIQKNTVQEYQQAYDYITSSRYEEENPGHSAERDLDTLVSAFVDGALDMQDKAGAPVLKWICKAVGFGPKQNPFIPYVQDYPKASELTKDQ